jgi:hypothetical protein
MRLRLSAAMQFFDWHPCQTTYFFAAAPKSKHKFFWKKFEHPWDGLKGEIQDVFHKKARSPNYVLHPTIRQIWSFYR